MASYLPTRLPLITIRIIISSSTTLISLCIMQVYYYLSKTYFIFLTLPIDISIPLSTMYPSKFSTVYNFTVLPYPAVPYSLRTDILSLCIFSNKTVQQAAPRIHALHSIQDREIPLYKYRFRIRNRKVFE